MAPEKRPKMNMGMKLNVPTMPRVSSEAVAFRIHQKRPTVNRLSANLNANRPVQKAVKFHCLKISMY